MIMALMLCVMVISADLEKPIEHDQGKGAFKKFSDSQKRKCLKRGALGETPNILLFVEPKHR